jgi:hypothetical protein
MDNYYMKKQNLIFLFVFTLVICAHADIADPIADYKNRHGLVGADIIYKWSIDIDGDGKNEVFLTLKEEWLDEVKLGEMPSWVVYLAKSDGSGYILSSGEDDDGHLSLGPVSALSTKKLYVGQITQIGKRGIVTMQTYTPKGQSTIAKIFAYTVEGDHLKRKLLATYDPDAEQNDIYNQYLSDAKRTKVQLQEVTP